MANICIDYCDLIFVLANNHQSDSERPGNLIMNFTLISLVALDINRFMLILLQSKLDIARRLGGPKSFLLYRISL